MKQRVESWVALLTQLCMWIPLRILFFYFGRLEVKNWRILDTLKGKPFIVAANHVSWFDPFLVSHLFRFQLRFFPFRYPTAPIHYFTWKRPFIWAMGSYPVFKGQGLDKTLKESLKILRMGNNIVIFPEGKVKRQGRRRLARRGIAYLASKTKVPIVPCLIQGFEPHKYALGFLWGDFFARKYKIKVTFGEPLFVSDVFDRKIRGLDHYKQISQLIMRRVYELED